MSIEPPVTTRYCCNMTGKIVAIKVKPTDTNIQFSRNLYIKVAHLNCLSEAVLISTDNIRCYQELWYILLKKSFASPIFYQIL